MPSNGKIAWARRVEAFVKLLKRAQDKAFAFVPHRSDERHTIAFLPPFTQRCADAAYEIGLIVHLASQNMSQPPVNLDSLG